MSQENRLRWGILGAARVNERLQAIVEADNAELVAVASRRAGASAEVLRKYAPGLQGSITTYNNLQDLLDDSRIQAIYLPLANEEHAEWSLKAISAGKHVLIEKPLAIRAADIDAVQAAAKKQGVTVMEGFMYHFHPQHARVRQLIDTGLIGAIRFVRASYSFMMRPARLYRLARDPDHGGGAMWDIGPYAIHSLRRWFDADPVAVSAMARYVESGADIATSGIIDFGEGRRGHFDISFECARRSEYEITGDKGAIKCHTVWQLPGDVPVISWSTDDGRRGEEQLLPANHFRLEIEHFSDCLLNGKPTALTLDDARMNCLTIEAVLRSAASGRTEQLGS